MRRSGILRRYELSLEEIANRMRPTLLGWVQYYGKFCRSALQKALRTLNEGLVRWAMQKYKRLRKRKARAWAWLSGVIARQPNLFAHWQMKVGVRQ